MKSKFMKGMNLQEQKKCGILVTVIGFVMFAIGFLLGDAHMGDFYSGLGCGLFACGAVRLLRVHRLSRDPEKAADYDAMLKDERTVYVANKARSMTFFHLRLCPARGGTAGAFSVQAANHRAGVVSCDLRAVAYFLWDLLVLQ